MSETFDYFCRLAFADVALGDGFKIPTTTEELVPFGQTVSLGGLCGHTAPVGSLGFIGYMI